MGLRYRVSAWSHSELPVPVKKHDILTRTPNKYRIAWGQAGLEVFCWEANELEIEKYEQWKLK